MNRLIDALYVLLCGAGFVACFAHGISRGNANETGIIFIPIVLIIMVYAFFAALFGKSKE
jgi:hypothetical protein